MGGGGRGAATESCQMRQGVNVLAGSPSLKTFGLNGGSMFKPSKGNIQSLENQDSFSSGHDVVLDFFRPLKKSTEFS